MPVIRATQVLESLAKTDVPSGSEITDAAMGERAECVMLNKGPYIVTAVRAFSTTFCAACNRTRKRSVPCCASRASPPPFTPASLAPGARFDTRVRISYPRSQGTVTQVTANSRGNTYKCLP
jgi:hypothetical protein